MKLHIFIEKVLKHIESPIESRLLFLEQQRQQEALIVMAGALFKVVFHLDRTKASSDTAY